MGNVNETNRATHPSFQHRLREHEAAEIYDFIQKERAGLNPWNYDSIDQYLCRFPYFSKYSEVVRRKLIANCEIKIYKQNELIFTQGDPSPQLYFMLRGTALVSVQKQDMGNIPVIIKILYDGQDFGE